MEDWKMVFAGLNLCICTQDGETEYACSRARAGRSAISRNRQITKLSRCWGILFDRFIHPVHICKPSVNIDFGFFSTQPSQAGPVQRKAAGEEIPRRVWTRSREFFLFADLILLFFCFYSICPTGLSTIFSRPSFSRAPEKKKKARASKRKPKTHASGQADRGSALT
ncbi:hypothetical protein F4815DRAFT_15158 [Daldinia loculata]|nr:hypothetical protein F4815DRAFT_15158 [Daldinia loculata]